MSTESNDEQGPPAQLAGSVPKVWSERERDALALAYKTASEKHGHYETLFAVARCALELRAAPILHPHRVTLEHLDSLNQYDQTAKMLDYLTANGELADYDDEIANRIKDAAEIVRGMSKLAAIVRASA